MQEKIKKFLIQSNIISSKDYDELISFATIDVVVPNNSLQKIKIFFNCEKPVDKKVCFDIVEKQESFKNQVIIRFNYGEQNDYNLNLLIRNFFKNCKDNCTIIKNLTLNSNCFTINNNIINFLYHSRLEMDEFKKYENKIINFLNIHNYEVSSFNYQYDHEFNANVDKLKKTKQTYDKSIIDKAFDDSKLNKYEKLNLIRTNKIIPIKDLKPENKSNVIVAKIFYADKITTRSGWIIYKFQVTDYSSAIGISCFSNNDSNSNLYHKYLDTFKIGDWVKVKIDLDIDSYNKNEVYGKIRYISKSEQPEQYKRIDDCKNKRQEFLVRTKMSAFDGLSTPEEIVKMCKEWGYDSVGVCDLYNVQAYPDLMRAAKKHGLKVNYGLEVELINKKTEIITNLNNHFDAKLSDCTYVVFDIETTGLNAYYEDIIEFGATKIVNGIASESIQFFVKPSKPIPSYITKLTHITNADVTDGYDLITALNKIKSFFSNHILIAHNGINFDLRFINTKLVQQGLEPINNVLIDTMQVSRGIFVKSSGHTLGNLARRYNLMYDETIAHRADFDADVLAKVWRQILNEVALFNNIETIQQLAKLQNDILYTRQRGDFACIYAKNQTGIKDLYKIVSYAHTDHLYGNPKVFFEDLEKYRDNLLIFSSPTSGEVYDCALNEPDYALRNKIQWYDGVFVAPISTIEHDIYYHRVLKDQYEDVIKRIINNAENKLVVAVSDAYYLHANQFKAHSIYVHSKLLNNKRHRLFQYGVSKQIIPHLHVLTTKEMLGQFNFLPTSQQNDIVINNPAKLNSLISDNICPLKNRLYAPKIEHVEENLSNLVFGEAKKQYGDNLPQVIKDRIDKELGAIIKNGYAVIYWISHLLVKQSLQDGYLVGSRGSVGSSLVAYFANISEINPLQPHYICPKCHHFELSNAHACGLDLETKVCPKCGETLNSNGHDIPFETFLGFNGEKIPDIDLNFSGLYQDKAHNFIKSMFGEKYTYRAGTISTVASKTAYGYVKKYFEEFEPETNPNTAEINYLVSLCENVKRTTGQHPGGIIIVPDYCDVFDFTPYNYPANDKEMSWYTTHFAFESIHDNLLKFDILGHDDPTTLRFLQLATKVDPKQVPFNDKKVFSLFNDVSALNILPKYQDDFKDKIAAYGLPEFGTEFVRGMLLATKPKSFADLVRISGLSHGTDVWLNNANDLITKNGLKLNEVIACRDDIMNYLINTGLNSQNAFFIMEDIRKGKKINEKYLPELKQANVPQWYLDSCNKIKYLFPKAHASAYVLMAYRIAWFKIYHPLAFYAAYFSIRAVNYDLKTLVSGYDAIKETLENLYQRQNSKKATEALSNKEKELITVFEIALELYARGYKILPPSLKVSDSTNFMIGNNAIIASFKSVDSLGEVVAETIVKERKRHHFTSKEDLIKRCKINKNVLEALEEIGILDELSEQDQMTLFE